jgi:hypothetical protein
MNNLSIRNNILLIGYVLLLANSPLLAQIGGNTGLRGTVTDPSGASIPGAKVTVTRVDTAEQRAVSSNSAGDWEARFLSVGAPSMSRSK